MFKVTQKATNRVSQAIQAARFDLPVLLNIIKEENPKVAEYLDAQASKSKHPAEVFGPGIVVYLLLREQWKMNTEESDTAGPDLPDWEEFQAFFETNPDLNEIPLEEDNK